MKNKIKVLVVDDSALVRKMLTEIMEQDSSIEVVGSAADPHMARDKIKKLQPDVLTLDVEMPKMDGITFLSNLMRLRPMPVVMVSTLTEKGADVTFDALELGAVDFITKPKLDFGNTIKDYGDELIEKIKVAANARVQVKLTPTRKAIPEKHSADVILKRHSKKSHFKTTDTIIAIGASTGGTEAIKEVLEDLPPDTPGVVITQHIPEGFSTSFAKRMDTLSAMTVYEASDGQQILPGHVYIAPGNRHMFVARDGARYICHLDDGPAVNRHRPSVDVLFRSIAQNVGKNAVGIILTGMGNDGAAGLKEILDSGATTIAQDEKSSVVWGMPGEAVKLGAASSILPLDQVAETIIQLSKDLAV